MQTKERTRSALLKPLASRLSSLATVLPVMELAVARACRGPGGLRRLLPRQLWPPVEEGGGSCWLWIAFGVIGQSYVVVVDLAGTTRTTIRRGNGRGPGLFPLKEEN